MLPRDYSPGGYLKLACIALFAPAIVGFADGRTATLTYSQEALEPLAVEEVAPASLFTSARTR